ncbi:hypothetical protein MRX96_033350 [Rhipicephalus microplus]
MDRKQADTELASKGTGLYAQHVIEHVVRASRQGAPAEEGGAAGSRGATTDEPERRGLADRVVGTRVPAGLP